MKNNFQKISLIISAIFFVFFCFALIFLYQKINDNNQKAELGAVTWQTEALRRSDIRTLDSSLQKIQTDRALFETHFAKSSDIVPFLDTIEKLAPTAGALAQVDSVNTQVNNTGLTVGLTATGSFNALYKFLTLLENSPYELDFLSVDIHKVTALDPLGKTVNDLKWEAVFNIQLLSFVQ